MCHTRIVTKKGYDKAFGVDQRLTVTNIQSEGNSLEAIEHIICEQLAKCGCVAPEAIKAIYVGEFLYH